MKIPSLLATAIIEILTLNGGNKIKARALFYPGSNFNFTTFDLIRKFSDHSIKVINNT